MMGVVVLGCGLAGLAGALQLPREPANLQMDLQMVVETFVVVVMGGLGSIAGAFYAAVLIGLVHAFGIHFFPQATLVLIFLTMALVLAVRPQGLMGELPGAGQRERVPVFDLGAHRSLFKSWGWAAMVVVSVLLLISDAYTQNVLEDVLIVMLFGLSLQWMMALSGWVSFGHAAYFGLGAYATALSHLHWSFNAAMAAFAGVALATICAFCMSGLLRRSTGVYLAMLSLAFAQMVWASASQWTNLTGGDNGLIGLNFLNDTPRWIFHIVLIGVCAGAMLGFARLVTSSFGAGLQAGRDAPQRAVASGLAVHRLHTKVFLMSASMAGLAGALWAISKGSVFPSVASVSNSVDALLVVLLGGVHHLWGSLTGSIFLMGLGAEIGRYFEYWRGLLGLLIMVLMVLGLKVYWAWPHGVKNREVLEHEQGFKGSRSAPILWRCACLGWGEL
jgi:branched-chain amino acid transport system permease protein